MLSYGGNTDPNEKRGRAGTQVNNIIPDDNDSYADTMSQVSVLSP